MIDKKRFDFVKPRTGKTVEKDPESIFRELQIPTVKGLWSQQADILRDYYDNFKGKSDVAIELPTGTGKTLIGLLIAEYRRRCNQERVIYLCPTRQLANQVYAKGIEYGLPVCLLIGSQKNYPEDEYQKYVRSKAIAITTYSAIYNTNPKLDDANTIIFDDAHSAENYISSLWNVEIKRNDNKGLFESIIELFKEDISDYHFNRIMNDDIEFYKPIYDLIPYPKYLAKLPRLMELLEENVAKCGNAKYAWSMINEHLEACQLFFSWGEINIKPLIPPTQTHRAFRGSGQRIFMSATLGEGGELERITGVKKISKIPIPKGWEKYSNGRRLILFPNSSFNADESLSVAINAIKSHGRALVLCPDNRAAEYFKGKLSVAIPRLTILQSSDIEDSLESFYSKKKAVLILTNRYDGIDLAGDICRLQILFGMPEATNLQEAFLWNRMNANSVLNELVKTRITQALGRCTRSSDDFANVLIIDPKLLKFCAKRENLSGFHPEIQAEIEFGLENSEKIQEVNEMVSFMDDFINDKIYYSQINDAINEIREEYEKNPKVEVQKLVISAENEVEFVYALWKKEMDRALEKVKLVTENLSGGKESDGYRAWWYYIAGNTAHLAKKTIAIDDNLDKSYYSSSLRSSNAASWLSDLIHHVPAEKDIPKVDSYLTTQVENIELMLNELGIVGTRFEKGMKQLIDLINDNDAKNFEKGLEILGKLLGYYSNKPSGDGTPDGIWILRDKAYGFEAKTEENEKDPVYIDACRQTEGHRKYIRENNKMSQNATIDCVLTSHKSTIRKDALPQSRDLYHLHTVDVRELALRTTHVLRRIRSVVIKEEGSNPFTKEHISNVLYAEKLTYNDIDNILKEVKLDVLEHVN